MLVQPKKILHRLHNIDCKMGSTQVTSTQAALHRLHLHRLFYIGYIYIGCSTQVASTQATKLIDIEIMQPMQNNLCRALYVGFRRHICRIFFIGCKKIHIGTPLKGVGGQHRLQKNRHRRRLCRIFAAYVGFSTKKPLLMVAYIIYSCENNMIFIIVDFTNCTVSIILWNNHPGPCADLHLQLLRVSTWELRVYSQHYS